MPLLYLTQDVSRLERAGLLREPRVVDLTPGPVAIIDGRESIVFCSNDYLGLAAHPALRRAAIDSIERSGVGACSSRLVSGTRPEHHGLEVRIAHWSGQDRALLMPTGFSANLAVLSSLAGRDDVIFSDSLNHASIVQGCRLSRAAVRVYPHRDVDALRSLLADHAGLRRRLIVTDALFSVDGDEAPLSELWTLARETGSALIVDEAHSLGVLGPEGRGLCAAAGFAPDILVGTFGKAFGVMGAFVAGPVDAIRLVESRAKPYVYTTAPPALLAAATSAALDLVPGAGDRRRLVASHADRLRQALRRLGFDTGAGRSHIVPQLIPGVTRALGFAEALQQRGIFVQALRPPTVLPGTERLRWSPTASHTSEHIDRAIAALNEVARDLRPAPHEEST